MRLPPLRVLFVIVLALILLSYGNSVGLQRAETLPTNSGNWTLGMGLFSGDNTALFDGYVDDLMANGITNLRVDIPDYENTTWLARSKAAVIRAVAKGAKVTWGVSSNNGNNAAYTITAANWPTFRQAILSAAAWAQRNGVYEFQLGNEEESHNDDTTITDAVLRTKIKDLATYVKVHGLFTRGNVSYSAVAGAGSMSAWNTLGRGAIDLLAFNLYLGGGDTKYYPYPDNFENEVVTMLGYFGSAHSYITEFSLNAGSLDAFSTDEAEQAAAISSMIDYMRASGVTRANFFVYGPDDTYGARKGDGTYRELWDSLLEVNVVDGIAELPHLVGSARATAESSRGSPTPYAPIAGAAAAGLFAFAAGAWYARRRWRAG